MEFNIREMVKRLKLRDFGGSISSAFAVTLLECAERELLGLIDKEDHPINFEIGRRSAFREVLG